MDARVHMPFYARAVKMHINTFCTVKSFMHANATDEGREFREGGAQSRPGALRPSLSLRSLTQRWRAFFESFPRFFRGGF